jgi:predicted nucleic acid-binding protein
MATTVADLSVPPDKVMLDTNVLLAATNSARAGHDDAMLVLNDWPGSGTILYVSVQILREYLAVATRPLESNGLGMPLGAAIENARSFRDRSTLLPESGQVVGRLLRLLADVPCGGKRIHDANIVATTLTHDVSTVLTANLKDFARFEPYVNLIGI